MAQTAEPRPCRYAKPTFRAKVLESQAKLLGAACEGTSTARSRELKLPVLECTANGIVTPPPYVGAPLLFLFHGWGAGAATFAFALPALAKHFAVYAFDLPGMAGADRCCFPNDKRDGGTSKEEPQASIDFFLRHYDAMYEALLETDDVFRESTTKVLCGHSIGGYLSALWMLKDLDAPKFTSLSLVSPVGIPERVTTALRADSGVGFRIVYSIIRRLWGLGLTPQTVLRRLPIKYASSLSLGYTSRRFKAPHHSDLQTKCLAEYMLNISRAPKSSEAAMNTILEPGAWAKQPLVKIIPQLPCKVSFMYGENDWMSKDGGETVVSQMKGRANLSVIPGADHNIHLQASDKFCEALVAHAASTS